MTARYLSQMLRTPIHWGRGLVVGRERRANRLRLYRGLLLVAYLVMNLGLPTGLGPKVAVAAADKSCHCSAESRAAGRCCCSVRLGQKPRSCVSPAASKEPATGRARPTFISENIDYVVWQSLGSKAGGEVIGEY